MFRMYKRFPRNKCLKDSELHPKSNSVHRDICRFQENEASNGNHEPASISYMNRDSSYDSDEAICSSLCGTEVTVLQQEELAATVGSTQDHSTSFRYEYHYARALCDEDEAAYCSVIPVVTEYERRRDNDNIHASNHSSSNSFPKQNSITGSRNQKPKMSQTSVKEFQGTSDVDESLFKAIRIGGRPQIRKPNEISIGDILRFTDYNENESVYDLHRARRQKVCNCKKDLNCNHGPNSEKQRRNVGERCPNVNRHIPIARPIECKYHEVCKPIISLGFQTKWARNPDKLVPYGGPTHGYTCLKVCANNVYESRMQEKVRIHDFKKKTQSYFNQFCLHCNAIYADGICRRELGCRYHQDKIERSPEPLLKSGKHDKEKRRKSVAKKSRKVKQHLCGCGKRRDIKPHKVPIDKSSGIVDYNFVVKVDSQDHTNCKITVKRSSLSPGNAQTIKLLIVEFDLTDCRSSTQHISDAHGENTRNDSKSPYISFTTENAELMAEVAEKTSSSSGVIRKPTFTERIGYFGQFFGIRAKDVSVTAEILTGAVFYDKRTVKKTSKMKVVSWIDDTSPLGCPSLLKGRVVTEACFCPTQPNMLLTLHSRNDDILDNMPCTFICAWDTQKLHSPYRILSAAADFTCICFSPNSAVFALAGMMNGSVALWNLEKPHPKLKTFKMKSDIFSVHHPNYFTPNGDETKGHISSVLSIVGIQFTSNSTSDNSLGFYMHDESFQVATMEEAGVIIFWQTEKVTLPEQKGNNSSENGSRSERYTIKLQKNLQVSLIHELSDFVQAAPLGILVLQINHAKGSNSMGSNLSGNEDHMPPASSPQFHVGASVGKSSPVHCIDFSPFDSKFFLAGLWDGRVFLCHTEIEDPIRCFLPEQFDRKPVLKVQWCQSRRAVFFVLRKSSTFNIYNLLEDELRPIDAVNCGDGAFLTLAVSPCVRSPTSVLLLSSTSGSSYIYTLNPLCTHSQSPDEEMILDDLLEEAWHDPS